MVIVVLLGLGLGLVMSIAGAIVMGVLDVDPSLPIAVSVAGVSVYAALGLSGWFVALARRNASLRDAGFRWPGIGPMLLAFPLVFGLMIVSALILQATDVLIGGVPSAQEQVSPSGGSLTTTEFLWLLLIGAITAPVVEEFFFRGLLLRYLQSRAGLAIAVVISSALFALLHFIPALFPALFAFGVFQALVVHRYNSLYPAIAMHALNNTTLLAAVYAAA